MITEKVITKKDCDDCATGRYWKSIYKKEILQDVEKIIAKTKRVYGNMHCLNFIEDNLKLLKEEKEMSDLTKVTYML
jgi:hypothetical protein